MQIIERSEPKPFNVVFTPEDQELLRCVLYAAFHATGVRVDVLQQAYSWYLELCKAQGLEPVSR